MSPILLGNARPRSKRWHALRRQGIGASEIGAVLGLSPWQSPFSLWHIKAGTVTPADVDNAATYWGSLHEPLVAKEWAARHPWAEVKRSATYARCDDPWMTANPDRDVFDGDQFVAVLECKTARYADGWGPDESDEIPVAYRAQVMQQMHVMEVPTAYVAVLIGSSDFRCYTIDYDPGEADVLVKAGRDFMQSIADGVPPDIDASTSTTATIKRLHPDVEDAEVIVPDDVFVAYRDAIRFAQSAEHAKAEATNRLLDALGAGRVAVTADGRRIATRSVSNPSRFDRAALRRDHPDVEARYTVVGDPAVRLTPNMKGLTES